MNKNIFLVMSVILVINFANVQSAQLGKELVKFGVNTLKTLGKETLPVIAPSCLGNVIGGYVALSNEEFVQPQNAKKFKECHAKYHQSCENIFDCYKQAKKDKDTRFFYFFLNFPAMAQLLTICKLVRVTTPKFMENCLKDFFVLPHRVFYQRISGKPHDLRPIFKFLPRNFSSPQIKNLGYLTLLIITCGWQRFWLKQIFSLPNYIPYVPEITSWIAKNSGLSWISQQTGITSFYQLDLAEYLINKGLKKWHGKK